jgi:hypothetical protein
VDLHLRDPSPGRAGDLGRGPGGRRNRGPRRLARLDPLRGDRGAAGVDARACDRRGPPRPRRRDIGPSAAYARGRACPRRRDIGPSAAHARGRSRPRRRDVGAPAGDRRVRTRWLGRRLDIRAARDRSPARLRAAGRPDVTRACRVDARGPPAGPTPIGRGRGPAPRGPARIGVGTSAGPPVARRAPVGVIAVVPDATPVPAVPVVPDPPRVRDPWVVVVPDHDQRRRRAPVVAPVTPIGVPEHERAVDVVVPASGPIHPRVGLDRLGVGVNVVDDHDLLTGRHRLVADHLRRLLLREGVGEGLVLDVHVGVGVVGGWQRARLVLLAGLVGLLVVARLVGMPCVGRRLGGGLLLPLAPGQRHEREEDARYQGRSLYRHVLSVPRAHGRYNPGDTPAPLGAQTGFCWGDGWIPGIERLRNLNKQRSKGEPIALQCVDSRLLARVSRLSQADRARAHGLPLF